MALRGAGQPPCLETRNGAQDGNGKGARWVLARPGALFLCVVKHRSASAAPTSAAAAASAASATPPPAATSATMAVTTHPTAVPSMGLRGSGRRDRSDRVHANQYGCCQASGHELDGRGHNILHVITSLLSLSGPGPTAPLHNRDEWVLNDWASARTTARTRR
jgi:hypothetical protein